MIMKNIKNLEIIQINTVNGKLVALASYQDLDNIDNLNNGFDTTEIPINIRKLQYSVRGNLLVDQSKKETNDNLIENIDSDFMDGYI